MDTRSKNGESPVRPRPETTPPPRWRYRHLIDLEYFIRRDKDIPEEALHQRDRRFFLNREEALLEYSNTDPRSLLGIWLDARIAEEYAHPDEKSPGAVFADLWRLTHTLATITGVLVGLISGFSFFSYSGTTPINVFHFLLLFIVSQHLLIVLLTLNWGLHRLSPDHPPPSFYNLVFKNLLVRMASFFQRQWLRGSGAEKRLAIEHALGVARTHSSRYGSLFYWPLFALSQLFAVGFNLGLLAATLLKLATSDLAFGWQSTLGVSAAALEQATRLAALPWSWLFSAGGVPSLAEIEGSRIVLKDGIAHLANQDLVAWWPFLVLCLLAYGLLPRLALLILGRGMAVRSLARLAFNTPPCQALTRRMLTPLVSTQAIPESQPETYASPVALLKATSRSPIDRQPVVLLVPDDIFDLYPRQRLAELLSSQHLDPAELHRFLLGYDEDQQLYRQLAERNWSSQEALGIVMEGWMPPLVDFLTVLRTLRRTIPTQTIIHLGLLGKPVGTATVELAPGDWKIWESKTAALADPYLHLFSLSL